MSDERPSSTLIVYAEIEWLLGERVRFTRMLGKGVRGNPYRDEIHDGVIARVWRTRLGKPERATGKRLRMIAMRVDGGGPLLISTERSFHHLVRKPQQVESITPFFGPAA